MKLKIIISVLVLIIAILCNCKDKKTTSAEMPIETPANTADLNSTFGFNIFKKLRGIWNGPVSSATMLGGYSEWIVDFRPISENQISAKNELDTLNDIFMSFFIAKYNNAYKVAFRNGGSFGGSKRVSYFLADSVFETTTKSFYRFSEIIKGKSRAYTEVIFIADSLYIKSYTNKKNTLPNTTPHMVWSARLQDSMSYKPTTASFGFPKKTQTKDFSNTFTGQLEAIYFSTSGNPANDPYPEAQQPYLGITNANYTYASGFTPLATKKVFLVISTQPLFLGSVVNPLYLSSRSRYVTLSPFNLNYSFNYMHPGTYYLAAFYDNDGNNIPNSGDWISNTNTTFSLLAEGITNTSIQINYVIP